MSAADLSFIRDSRLRWFVLLLIASLPLVGWWSYGLFDLDEGFYAAVTGSMIRHKEWITPLLNGHPWFEKPILIYWVAKPSVMLFGQDIGPRLPSVLATIATYALVAWFVRRRIGGMAAVLSLFILGSSLSVVTLGRMMMTDPLLLFFFTASVLTYYESLVDNRRWSLIAAFCLGLAVLTKGPVAIVLFVAILLWTLQLNRLRPSGASLIREKTPYWPVCALITLAVMLSWFVPAYLANGNEFVDEFIIKQNIGRFTGGDQAHTLPFYKSFWFYIPILLVGMFPWILWLPNAITNRYAIRDKNSDMGGDIHLRKFMVGWAVIVFCFFTISGAKLPHYILPCCPPIAILVAAHLAEKWKALTRDQIRGKLTMTLVWLVAVWVIAQFGFETWYVRSGQQEAHQFAKSMRSQESRVWPVITYQLSRQQGTNAPSGLKIQETSLPSMSFYLNRDLIDAHNLDEAFSEAPAAPFWIFTRVGRITLDDVDASDRAQTGKILLPQQKGENFETFIVWPTSEGSNQPD